MKTEETKRYKEKRESIREMLSPFYAEIPERQIMYHAKFSIYEIQRCSYCNAPLPWKPYNSGYYDYCMTAGCKKQYDKDRIAKQWASMSEEKRQARKEKWTQSRKASNVRTYGKEWHQQTQDWKDKVKDTSIEKYGTEHYLSNEEVKKKRNKTNLEKYGVECILACKPLMEEGMMKRYGVNNPMKDEHIRNKVNNTNRERYGSEWITNTDYFKSKSLNFYREKFGVEHNSQLPEVLEKRARKGYMWKDYVFPSGKTVKLQGYEDQAIDALLLQYEEKDIIVDNQEIEQEIGKILYTSTDGKIHRYMPDIYIKSTNTVIEVKSEWTFQQNKDINELKRNACIDLNVNFQYLIIS